MSIFVTKFKYLKPGGKKKRGGYAKYIGTRDGVEVIDDTHKAAPVSLKQKEFISKLIEDYPECLEMIEYEDFKGNPTMGNASEFISRAIEENADSLSDSKTYADYIATRPRAQRFGSHGLFSDEGDPVILSKVSKELNDYEGNVWTVILSLRREDAERLGFDQGERWRDLLRAHAQELSDQFHIPMENLRWYAAFHNESHHPHCHLMVFSSDPKEGYLSKQGFHSLRESLIKEIFAQDLMNEYSVEWLTKSAEQGYTVAKYKLGKMFLHGDQVQKNLAYALRWLEDAVRDNNPYAEYLLGKCFLLGLELDQDILRGEEFLRKAIQQRNRFAEYTLGKALLDGKLVLQDIPEAIKHLTASADQGLPTAQYVIGKLLYQGELLPRDVLAALDRLEAAAAQKNPYAAYLAAKIRLVKGEYKDVERVIQNLEIAAEGGNDYAEYQLGKLYLYGKEVGQDIEKAIDYLTKAAEHGNQYAAQLLVSMQNNRNWSAALGALRLAQTVSRIFQRRMEDERKSGGAHVDRKLRRKSEEKKQAQGLKSG